MKKTTFLLCLFACFFPKTANAQKPTLSDFKPGTVIFKLLPEHRDALAEQPGKPAGVRLADPVLQNICSAKGDFSVRKNYPHHAARPAAKGRVDLSLIGELQFSATTNVPAMCRELLATGRFEYVEPRFLYRAGGGLAPYSSDDFKSSDELGCDSKLLFTPNDPLFPQQWHLPIIHAPEAWDVEQGDSSIVIGIVDTGVDYLHPDLAGNIARNYADPVNGVDDDQNGFVDDYLGWDFEYNDNDPGPTADFHGTGVAGIASGSTNNGIGLAAPGFKCRVLPVKGTSLEGMVYAADRGCKVINCSWGGANHSQYDIDVVNYCTFEKDALVVAVAGNQNNSAQFWPGAADHAMSVAATDKNDKKEPYSNFSRLVDISAPGSIWATWANGGYTSAQAGTSWSTALVSGAAALVRAHFPNFTALQTAERLRITADDISAQNPNYVEQLGKGRLNIFRALTDPATPAVRLRDAKFSNGTGGSIAGGDTVRLDGLFVNYLADATNLTVTISSPNPNVSFLQNTFSQNLLATLDTASNAAEPFVFVISPNLPFDTELQLRLGFQADGYADWQGLTLTINPTSTFFDNGIINTTLFSSGSIGIRSTWGDGIPISYKNSTITSAAIGALMLGASTPTRVSDAALTDLNVPTFDKDFRVLDALHPVGGSGADLEFACVYNDSTAPPPTSMGLLVRQKVYGWTGDHFFITEYEVTNNSAVTRDNFRIGFLLEPDITYEYIHNRAERDSALQLGYVYALSPNLPYFGLQLLSDPPMNLYVYEWLANYGGVNLLDNFSTSEKLTTLTTSRPAGGFGDADGEDVGMVGSAGPFQFAPGQTLKAAFAVLFADSLEALRAAAMQAKMRYDHLVDASEPVSAGAAGRLKIYPNPAGDMIWIETAGLETARNIAVEVYDLSGKTVSHLFPKPEGNALTVSTGHLPAGIYLLRMRTEEGVRTGKFVKQ